MAAPLVQACVSNFQIKRVASTLRQRTEKDNLIIWKNGFGEIRQMWLNCVPGISAVGRPRHFRQFTKSSWIKSLSLAQIILFPLGEWLRSDPGCSLSLSFCFHKHFYPYKHWWTSHISILLYAEAGHTHPEVIIKTFPCSHNIQADWRLHPTTWSWFENSRPDAELIFKSFFFFGLILSFICAV